MRRETLFVPFDSSRLAVEKRADGKPVIVGYAAVFYDGTERTQFELWDGMVERITPGAFRNAVATDDVRALFNHNSDHVLGRSTAGTLSLTEDDVGLRYEITPGDTSISRDVQEYIARREITGSSFSFSVLDETSRKEGGLEIRELRGVKLYDVGPVTFPAYEGTTAAIRSNDPESVRRQIEELKNRISITDGHKLALTMMARAKELL
jgi:HK97 family phage prohead protease